MTATSTGQEKTHKPQRRALDEDERRAVWMAGYAFIIVVIYTVASYVLDRSVFPLVAAAAALVGIGVFGSNRALVGSGIVGLAIGGVVLMQDLPPGRALALGAVVVTVCLAAIALSDLSFAMRRGTNVADQTLAGLAGFQGLAWVLGVAASVSVVIAVTSVTLPAWLGVVAIAVLAVAMFIAQRRVRRYQRELRQSKANLPPPRRDARGRPPPPPPRI